MAAPVAADDLGIDRIDPVAGRHQRPDQQTPVGLDADRHLPGLLGMGGYQPMQLPHPRQAIRDPAGRQDAAVLVEQAQVMVGLAPVHPQIHHGSLLRSNLLAVSQRRTCGALMAVLIWHDIPPAVRPPQHQPGHGLTQELQAPKPPSAHRLVAPP
jgi:hypothetical protein